MKTEVAIGNAVLLVGLCLLISGCVDGDETGEDVDSGTDVDTDADSDTDSENEPQIALVQYNADIHFGKYDLNLANLLDLSLEAVEAGAKIIVHSEASTYGYATADEVWCSPGKLRHYGKSCRDVSEVAEQIPGGKTTSYWESFAKENQVYVIYHLPEVDGEVFFNSIGVVGSSGYVTKYRKRTLYYIDQAYAKAGRDSVVLETPYGDFGLMICLDGTYDGGYYNAYKNLQVDAIVISMDWDQNPNGPRSASSWFTKRAKNNDIEIYASDVSAWDGTAKYLPGQQRERNGLPEPAIGIDGVSYHVLEY